MAKKSTSTTRKRHKQRKYKFLTRYMAAFFRQVKIGVLTLTLEKKQ